MGKFGCMGERCSGSRWWAADLKACHDAFVGRRKESWVWGRAENCRKPQRAATQEGNLVCRVTRDSTFQMKLRFCF